MAKVKQSKTQKEEFDESDMREVKPDCIERDERNGWDYEKSTYFGEDVKWAFFDQPVKSKKLIYVKLPDGSFRFSPRPDRNPLVRRRGRTLPHSMLGKGDKVIGAGECETDKNGKIASANNHSGHYQPEEKNAKETNKNMKDKGLVSDDFSFGSVDTSGKVIKLL